MEPLTSYRRNRGSQNTKKRPGCFRRRQRWRSHNKHRFRIVTFVVSGVSACYGTTLQRLTPLWVRSPRKKAKRVHSPFVRGFEWTFWESPHAIRSLCSPNPQINKSTNHRAAKSTADAPKTRQRRQRDGHTKERSTLMRGGKQQQKEEKTSLLISAVSCHAKQTLPQFPGTPPKNKAGLSNPLCGHTDASVLSESDKRLTWFWCASAARRRPRL